ncbi:hypothetical protein N9M08_08460 [Porticoccaceae bacterium]|nr:hypothetical protein [Porticoccaceae bacterium]MDA8682551.1 hypothetical protein [Porticoccaceae bacterium]MDA8788905.1 hypothetical protein [Porticoccaceae bacterium]MDB2635137.1 hypothetical protein [Porticoccaceae bacterium]MDB2664968.1 hypothetical protein [Porticoccaceae bacterium]
MSIKVLIASLLCAVLVGCGGGGGSSQPVIPVPAPVDPDPIGEILQVEATVNRGQSTELVLYAPGFAITSIQWQQTAGADVEFYANDSKVIGFTPSEAGSYSFDVIFDADGINQTLSHSFTVSDTFSELTVRLGHAVIEDNAVSLTGYATSDTGSTPMDKSSWTWSQTEGPSVTFTESDTDGEVAVFFDAPAVARDTILTFELSGVVDEQTYTDEISILVENSSIAVEPDNVPFSSRVAEVFLYNPDSPAGQTLIDCVYSNETRYDQCTFGDTPLIAQLTTTPTIDDIMDRVVVSHKWMGDQFRKYLETYDQFDDFKNLLRATTAIVISYDVRPAFYSPTIAAIYIDPSYLWETPAQRDTINQAPDYRSNFGEELQFEMPWRYVKDNDYAYYSYPIRYRLSRTLEDLHYALASLLYHELAHANDYFPSTNWLTYSTNTTVYDAVVEVYNANEIISDFLQDNYPLDPLYASGGQNELTKLAQVRFRNPDLVTDEQIAYTMEDVANMFKTEGAPQFYSYSSTREDLAILFDGFMMHARYGVSRDVAVSDQAYSDIVWGQRDRMGEEWIKPRMSFVTKRILPEYSEADSVIQNLSPPLALDADKTWRNSVVLDSTQRAEGVRKSSKPAKRVRDPRLVPQNGVHSHNHIDLKRLNDN